MFRLAYETCGEQLRSMVEIRHAERAEVGTFLLIAILFNLEFIER